MCAVWRDRSGRKEENAMKRAWALLVLFAGALLASGCNTVAGIGKDVEKAGEVVQDAAKKK
jgi:predicted small secreted protein